MAKALTTSYVASTYSPAHLDPAGQQYVWLECTVAGTAMTSLQLRLDGSIDGTLFGALATEEVSAGQVVNRSAEHTLYDTTGTGLANGTYVIGIPVARCPFVKLYAKRTGGGADSTLLVRAHFV